MQTYMDSQGGAWPIRVTVATLRKCKEVVDLANPESWLDEVYREPTRLTEIVYAICRTENSPSLEEFENRIAGEEIGKLRAALLQEMIDFFQDRTGRGELLAALVAQTNQTIATKLTQAVAEITNGFTD